jgi:hypothetical protein
MRDKSREFPAVSRPAQYTSARVWHCSYRSLAALDSFVNLRSLEIATYPDATFEPISGLLRLEALRVIHMPRITDLEPLRKLTLLRHLSLETLPSWDVSGKVTEVRSLAPLAELTRLESLELYGVRPPNRRIDDLLRIPSLREAKITKYAEGEAARLADVLGRRASGDVPGD